VSLTSAKQREQAFFLTQAGVHAKENASLVNPESSYENFSLFPME